MKILGEDYDDFYGFSFNGYVNEADADYMEEGALSESELEEIRAMAEC